MISGGTGAARTSSATRARMRGWRSAGTTGTRSGPARRASCATASPRTTPRTRCPGNCLLDLGLRSQEQAGRYVRPSPVPLELFVVFVRRLADDICPVARAQEKGS